MKIIPNCYIASIWYGLALFPRTFSSTVLYISDPFFILFVARTQCLTYAISVGFAKKKWEVEIKWTLFEEQPLIWYKECRRTDNETSVTKFLMNYYENSNESDEPKFRYNIVSILNQRPNVNNKKNMENCVAKAYTQSTQATNGADVDNQHNILTKRVHSLIMRFCLRWVKHMLWCDYTIFIFLWKATNPVEEKKKSFWCKAR